MSYEPPENQPPPMPGGAVPPPPGAMPPPPGAVPPPPQNLPPADYAAPPPAYGAPPAPGYQQYGAQPGYPPPEAKNNKATIALVLGIIAILCLGPITGIPALIVGYLGLKDSEQMGGNGKGLAIAGMVLGGISLLFAVAWIAYVASQS